MSERGRLRREHGWRTADSRFRFERDGRGRWQVRGEWADLTRLIEAGFDPRVPTELGLRDLAAIFHELVGSSADLRMAGIVRIVGTPLRIERREDGWRIAVDPPATEEGYAWPGELYVQARDRVGYDSYPTRGELLDAFDRHFQDLVADMEADPFLERVRVSEDLEVDAPFDEAAWT